MLDPRSVANRADHSYQQALDEIADQCMAECADVIPEYLKDAWWRRFRKIAQIEIGDSHDRHGHSPRTE